MEKLLSIVVPAYNVEKYIDQCLESFIVPEIMDRIEVLIINDGSKDKTLANAMPFCDKYPEVFRIYNKPNGGHGSAINCGIQHAVGKYFRVVDGDDWLNKKSMREFVNLLGRIDSDLVATDFLCVQDGTGDILQDRTCTLDPEQYYQEFSFESGEIETVIKMHSFTIKTSILQDHGICLDEHSYYVDAEYITFPIPYVKSVYFCPLKLYMYRLGRSGQSVDIKSMQRNRDQHMHILNQLLSYYQSFENIDASVRLYMEKCIGLFMENQFQIYISMGNQKGIRKELKEWDENLKEHFPGVYRATNKKSIHMLRKTNYLILRIGYWVYGMVK